MVFKNGLTIDIWGEEFPKGHRWELCVNTCCHPGVDWYYYPGFVRGIELIFSLSAVFITLHSAENPGPWLGLETASIVCYAVGGVSFFLAATGLLLRPRDYDWAGEPKWIARRVYLEFLSGLAWIGNGVLMMQPHGVEKDYYDPNGVEAPTVGWYGVVGMSFMMGLLSVARFAKAMHDHRNHPQPFIRSTYGAVRLDGYESYSAEEAEAARLSRTRRADAKNTAATAAATTADANPNPNGANEGYRSRAGQGMNYAAPSADDERTKAFVTQQAYERARTIEEGQHRAWAEVDGRRIHPRPAAR